MGFTPLSIPLLGRDNQPALVVGTTGTSAADTSLRILCHFEGSNNSTTVTDSSSYNSSFTCSGGAKITTTYKKFGTSCLDATVGTVTGPSITIPSNTPYSIDFWTYVTIYNSGAVKLGSNSISLYMDSTGGDPHSVFFYGDRSGSGTLVNSKYGSMTFAQFKNNWYHLCYLYDQNGVMWTFVNGTLCLRYPRGFYVSSLLSSGGTLTLSGGIFDELRITIGANKYYPTPKFTVPSSPYDSLAVTFPSPATQGQLWSDGTYVYICTVAGSPGTWRRFTVDS